MPGLINLNEEMMELASTIESDYVDIEKQNHVPRSTEVFDEEHTRVPTYRSTDALERMFHLFHNIPGYRPSYFQRELFKESVQCFSPIILNDLSTVEMAAEMKKFDMTPPDYKFLFGGTSRRGGKTHTATITAADLLACVPNIPILYYSLYEKTCIAACNLTYEWLRAWGFVAAGRVKKTKLSIIFKGDSPNDVRELVFFSGQNKNVYYYYLFFIYYFLCSHRTAATGRWGTRVIIYSDLFKSTKVLKIDHFAAIDVTM